jgi:hypothetical protein
LSPRREKFVCPSCGQRTLGRYINSLTQEYLPPQYGRCDREIKCGYHVNPYKEGYHRENKNHPVTKENKIPQVLKYNNESWLTFVPKEVLQQTLLPSGYAYNIFIQNLLLRVPFVFDISDVEKVVSQYYIGTIQQGGRAGCVTFPFIDNLGNVRTIQAKLFNKDNHTTATDFVHSIIERECKDSKTELPDWLITYKHNDLKVSCLFGEHLLPRYPNNPVALVEAPKTAIYGTLYIGFPDNPKNLLWLAVYNLSSLTYEKCKALQGRDVFLFPDLSSGGRAFNLWRDKAIDLTVKLPGTRFIVSDFLESLAPEAIREKGYDLADILINMDWRHFRLNHVSPEFKSFRQSLIDTNNKQGEKGEKNERQETIFFSYTDTSQEVLTEVKDDAVSYKREPYKGLDFLYTCPHCKSLKMFVRYIDPMTGIYFGEYIGKCNRETLCGYDLKPGRAIKKGQPNS